MYKGIYLGRMTEYNAEAILRTRDLKVVPNLKNLIFNFDIDLVKRSLDEGRSIREILKEESYLFTNYAKQLKIQIGNGLDVATIIEHGKYKSYLDLIKKNLEGGRSIDDIINDNSIIYKKYIGTLRDYQTVGVAFMYLSPRSIIGDGVGLGKTAEIAGLLNYLKKTGELTRFMMAVETSALGQIQYELMRFTGLHIVQLPSESSKLKKAIDNIDWVKVDGIVIKHSALRSDILSHWLALNINEDGTSKIFNTFILDESSVIKNMNTKIAMYTKNMCDLATRVHFMNATVFELNIMDIYNQVDMLDRYVLPRKYQIEKDFCVFSTRRYWVKNDGRPQLKFRRNLDGYKNQKRFKEILKLFYFGRSKEDIGLDRPHIFKVFEVEPSNDQSLALAKGYRYMEVLNAPSTISELGIPTTVDTVPKLKRLVELVNNDFANDKIVIYAFHIDSQLAIAEALKKANRNPVILNGENTDEERWAIQKGFNRGSYDVIVTNIQKSLNLYGGDVLIFYYAPTNPAKIEQVRGRIDRNVDDKIKTFVLLLYKGTDEYKFFRNTVQQRVKDSRDLTIDAKTAVDYFMNRII